MAEPVEVRDESLRYIVAGMLSTISFVPSQSHPAEMLSMADSVIHHIRLMSQQETKEPQTVVEVNLGEDRPF